MRKWISIYVVAGVTLVASWSNLPGQQLRDPLTDFAVYFSPKGGCTDALVREIDGAQKEILVEAYEFSSRPVAEALAAAHTRGVSIRILVERTQRNRPLLVALAQSGVLVAADTIHTLAHSKVMIIDRATVITGSFNLSDAAETRNSENLLVLHRRDIAEPYCNNFATTWIALVGGDAQQGAGPPIDKMRADNPNWRMPQLGRSFDRNDPKRD